MKSKSQILSPFLPGFLYRLFPTSNNILRESRKGLHSDAIIVGSKLVIKLLGGKRREYSNPEEALRLGKLMHEYFLRLKGLSPLLVPEFLETAIVTPEPHDPAVVCLVVLAPYAGVDLEEAIRQKRLHPRKALESVLDLIEPILAMGLPQRNSVVGIDTKPANFCLTQKGRPTFVDFVPPRFRQDDGTYLVDYPQPTTGEALDHGTWKYYTSEGIVTNLLAQFCRVVPTNWQGLLDTLLTWCEEHGHQELAYWLGEQEKELLNPVTLNEQRNPLMLRLAGCKLAAQNAAFRTQLPDFFRHITRYEHGDLEPLLRNARAYINNFIHTVGTVARPTGATGSRAARTVAFVSTQTLFDLESYKVFGEYVCYDREVSTLLRTMKNRIGRLLSSQDLSQPANFLICAPPGSGKTFMVEQLAKSFDDVQYVYSNVSRYSTTQDAIRHHIREILEALNPKRSVIACLDEADCTLSGEHVFKLLLQPMNGKPFAISPSNKEKVVLKDIVWCFLASSGATCADFFKMNAMATKIADFYSRVPREHRVDVPYDADAPEENIVKGVSIMFRKAREQRKHVESVEAMVLGYLGFHRFESVREMELLVDDTIKEMAAKECLVAWRHLAVGTSEKVDAWNAIKSCNADMASTIVRVRPLVALDQ